MNDISYNIDRWNKNDKGSFILLLYHYDVNSIIPEKKFDDIYISIYNDLSTIINKYSNIMDFYLNKVVKIEPPINYNYNNIMLEITGTGSINNGLIYKETIWCLNVRIYRY